MARNDQVATSLYCVAMIDYKNITMTRYLVGMPEGTHVVVFLFIYEVTKLTFGAIRHYNEYTFDIYD